MMAFIKIVIRILTVPVDTCVPAAVMTFVGLVTGLTGALSHSAPLLLLSWSADVLDGVIARADNAETEVVVSSGVSVRRGHVQPRRDV